MDTKLFDEQSLRLLKAFFYLRDEDMREAIVNFAEAAVRRSQGEAKVDASSARDNDGLIV